MACQTRDGDLRQFFVHENQAAPPSLSLQGTFRSGTKADLSCLELDEMQPTATPCVDAKVLDGAAVVQMLKPGASKTFQDYADKVFTPYVVYISSRSN